jgi:polyhydroxyalkanoate synthesis regulator phasin
MTHWKDDLFKAAMKVMQNPTAQKVVSNDKFQKAVTGAFKASFAIKSELEDKKADIARKMNLATSDDLRTMKRELDRLQRQVAKLKKEKEEGNE